MAHVLLIGDDARLAQALARAGEGYEIELAADGGRALRRLREGSVDLCLLVLAPAASRGLEVLRRARQQGCQAPILVLGVSAEVRERVRALELGADDYLVRPFALAELLARMEALQRRGGAPAGRLRAGDVELDTAAYRAFRGGAELKLSKKELALLELLLRRRGQVLGRREILKRLWGYDHDPGTNVVAVHISHLRRKLGAPSWIETVRGAGYRLRGG